MPIDVLIVLTKYPSNLQMVTTHIKIKNKDIICFQPSETRIDVILVYRQLGNLGARWTQNSYIRASYANEKAA